ncbi:DUF2125 domain-containing protein [Falsigemmobacter faecalis]|nr:DUF2125 domain-containing protein [Falsigemmobacter faecalis]
MRQSVFTGAFVLLSAPAFAQISADELWKNWQAVSADMGYELAAGDLVRSGDRLVAKDVTFNMSADDVKIINRVPEMVLRETGGAVEVTTSPDWLSETTVKVEDETQTITTTLSQTGYLMTVTGTAAEPAYQIKADSLSFAQKMPITEGGAKTPGSVNTSGTLSGLAGDFTLTGSGEAQQMRYNFIAADMKMVLKADGGADQRSSFTLDVKDIASDFQGSLPPKAAAETDLTALLKSGLNGVSNNKSGAVEFTVDVTSPDLPFKGEGRFSSTSSSFGMTDSEIKLDLDLNGIQAGPAGDKPSASDLLLRGLALLNPNATDDDEAFKSGTLTVTINDSQALLDNLSATGLIPADQMMGVQMMLAMFSKAGEKPGSLTSTLEITEAGDFLVNGQSMQ